MRGVKLASETADTVDAALRMARPSRVVRDRLPMVAVDVWSMSTLL